ncbi:MAG: Asp-tRNA(Asn)/Glu-tRNA(Gln) amidotransferase subunit GatA [Planctomycetota bacterium]
MSVAPDAHALRDALASGERTVPEVIDDALRRIEATGGALGAFHEVLADGARARAAELEDQRAAGGPLPPLFGLPVALKENLCFEGAHTPCGSRLLADYRAPYTATAARRLVDAGAVVVGMTHMDEFAMGSSGENSAFETARNPWDPERTPGGSSSGSAVAVAAGLVPLALGSDTGGSVRQPAALTGVTGFKPTYGRVSRYGLVAFGSSLDQVSPFARSARDVELVYRAIRGADPMDMTTLPAEEDGASEAGDALRGKRVGVPREYFSSDLDDGVRARIEAALATLVELGAERVDVSLPTCDLAIPTYYVVATAEASSNLARYEGVRFGARERGDGSLAGMMAATRNAGFGDEVKRRILLGTYVLSSGYHDEWYGRAQRVRAEIAGDFERVFGEVDLVVGPTSPTTAFRLGERRDDPVAMYLSDLYTVPANLAGVPAVSVPAGCVDGLPVGLQLTGPRGADDAVLAAAKGFQEATDHHHATPAAWAGEEARA